MTFYFLVMFAFVGNVKIHSSRKYEAVDSFQCNCVIIYPLIFFSSVINFPLDFVGFLFTPIIFIFDIFFRLCVVVNTSNCF